MGFYPWDSQRDVSCLQGLTLQSVAYDRNLEEIRFKSTDGREFVMHHCQDCCESVGVDEIVGDLQDLVGTPIILAEDVSNEAPTEGRVYGEKGEYQYSDDSFTWTFYRFRTAKGNVDIRWYGSSNGYYSERVDFSEMTSEEVR